MDILSTSGINNLVNNYRYTEQQKLLTPLEKRKSNYSQITSAWGDLSSKLSSFKDILSNFRVSTSSSLFNNRKATLSNFDFLSATAEKNASVSAYNMRVSQLAKSDLVVSDTMTSDTDVSTMLGTHKMSFASGEYTANVEFDLTDAETNSSVMTAMHDAVNADKAVVESAELDSSTTYTGAGEFKININGTETTISYDYTAQTYDAVMDDLVDQINNNVDGVVAKKVVDGSNVSLSIEVEDTSEYITINGSDDTGTLLNSSNLNIDVEKDIAASQVVTTSVFTPTTGNSKISFTAKETGYDNRLIMQDVSGSALDFVGLTSAVLTGRTSASDDTTAGFMYSATSETDNELNAKFNFNGINIQRNSNSVDDLVTNVTFDLKATMDAEDADVNVAVDVDTDEIKGQIEEFIEKFNEVYTYIKSRSTTVNSSRGIFVGEATASTLLRSFQSYGIGEVSGLADDSVSYLAQIGIRFDPSTGLTISDSTELEQAIAETPDQVADLFNSDNGIATQMYDLVDGYIGADGTIANIKASYENSISYLSDRITSVNSRIDKSADVLRSRYEELQVQYAQMLSNQSFFQQTNGGFF